MLKKKDIKIIQFLSKELKNFRIYTFNDVLALYPKRLKSLLVRTLHTYIAKAIQCS